MYIPTSDLNLQSTTIFAVLHTASCAYYDSGWLKPWHTAHLKPTGCKRCGLPFTVMQLIFLLKFPFHVQCTCMYRPGGPARACWGHEVAGRAGCVDFSGFSPPDYYCVTERRGEFIIIQVEKSFN